MTKITQTEPDKTSIMADFKQPNAFHIKQKILFCFKNKPFWKRKEIILEVINNSQFPKEALKNTACDSDFTKYKSVIGRVLSKMIANGDINVNEYKDFYLTKEDKVLLKEAEIEQEILSYLNSGIIGYTKSQLFVLLDKRFRVNQTPNDKDDKILHSIAGNVISRLQKQKITQIIDGKYLLITKSKYPNTDIGNCLKKANEGASLYECFVDMFNYCGGEFFEVYVVKLLEKYFLLSNKTITSAKVTGGANDNGIDGIIETEDWLGYKEKVFIQAKTRIKATVTLKEVREFYGALCAELGTRGVFITNSVLHKDATKFINRLHNVVSIDKVKLFELAKKCEVGVLKTASGGYVFDDQMFLTD
ncbi:MAG: restriction endonuclease [Clostridia bacterium]